MANRLAQYQANVERRIQNAELEAEKARGERLAAAERLRATRWRLRLAVAMIVFVTVSAAAGWLYVQSAVTTAAAQQAYAAQLDQQAEALQAEAIAESWNDVAWSRYVENRRFSATARREAEKRLGWLLAVPGLASATGNSETRAQADQAEQEHAQAKRDRDFCLAIREAHVQGTSVRNETFDFTKEIAALQEALAAYGVDLQRPQAAAALINASAVRDELVGVCDELLQYGIVLDELAREPTASDIKTLLTAADPHPVRQKLRNHLANAAQGTDADARIAIRSLVDEWDFQDHPFATSLVLCDIQGGYDGRQAIASLTRLVEQNPRLFEAHNALGFRYLLLDPPDLTAALGHWQAAAVLTPDSPGINLNLGNLLEDLGRYTEAEACFQRAIELQPDYASAHQNLASVLTILNRLDEAEAEYRKAIELRQDNPLAYSSLGKILVTMNRRSEAEQCFRKAIELAPQYPPLYHSLAMLLEQQNRTREAEASYRESIRRCATADTSSAAYLANILSTEQIDLQQAEAAARHDLGLMLVGQNRLEEAEALYRSAIEIKPDLAQAHRTLGDLLSGSRRFDEAEACYRESLRIDPSDTATYINLANLLAGQNQFDEAEALYRKVIETFPNVKMPKAHLSLGALLYRQGRLEEAEASLRKAVELQGDLPTAVSNLGGVLVERKKYEEGEMYLRRAIAIDPKYVSPYMNLTVLLRRQGRHDEAETLLRNGLQQLENDGTLHCYLGRVLRDQGKLDEAVTFLKRGHDLGVKQPGWAFPSQQWLAEAEWELAAESTLKKILAGGDAPEDAEQLIQLAWLCQQSYYQRYEQSVEFYKQAFDLKAELAQVSPQSQHRYNAACAAALASTAASQGEEEQDLQQAALLREQARQWLEADLKQWAALREPPAARAAAVRALTHWLDDSDLVSVREAAQLQELSAEERELWETLWSEVQATLDDLAE